MNYLKVVNCPLGSILPKNNNKVDWESCGFDISEVKRKMIQGDDLEGNYVSLIPISNEELFSKYEEQLIYNVNNNEYENDSAEIVNEEQYNNLKNEIENLKNSNSDNSVLSVYDKKIKILQDIISILIQDLSNDKKNTINKKIGEMNNTHE